MTTDYVLRPIPPAVAEALRRTATVVHTATEKPGYPCRQCLRDANPGEELVLVSYDPFDVDSPYRSASPIFLHRLACGEPPPAAELPTQLTCRQLGVRAFDSRAMIVDAAIIDGTTLDATVRRMLGDPDVDHLHVHNATRGCWAVRVTRAPAV